MSIFLRYCFNQLLLTASKSHFRGTEHHIYNQNTAEIVRYANSTTDRGVSCQANSKLQPETAVKEDKRKTTGVPFSDRLHLEFNKQRADAQSIVG